MRKKDENREQAREPWLRAVDPDEAGPSWLDAYRKPALAVAAVVLVAFGGSIWYAYEAGGGAIGEAPLVQAPDGPVRHKPEDPGGLAVPDRDKLVYNRVNGAPGAEDVHLLPGPELPMDKPEPDAARTDADAQPDVQPDARLEAAPAPLPMTDPLADGTPSRAVVEDREPAPPAEPPAAPVAPAVTAPAVTAPAAPADPAPAKAEPAKPAAVSSGRYLLQLGAFSSEAAADAAWAAAQKKFPAALGSLHRDVAPLTRDGKTLYRLRGAGFADKTAADAACLQLKAGGHPCFVAK